MKSKTSCNEKSKPIVVKSASLNYINNDNLFLLNKYIIDNPDLELIKNMSITTSTVDAKIDGLYFNEKELTEEFTKKLQNTCDDNILKFSSNYLNPPIISVSYGIILKQKEIEQTIINNSTDPNKKKRGRKKKDKNKNIIVPRKLQGLGISFNSQISISLKSFKYPDKIYNIKWFRTGTLGCPGILDIEDLKISLNYLINKLSINFDTNISLLYINSNMINYKTYFTKKNDNIIKLNNLAQVLNEKHTDVLFKKVVMNPEKNNSISIRFKNDPEYINKKDYLVEIFLSGKLNLKGIFPINLMIEHIKIISKYLFEHSYNIIIDQIVSKDDILKIIDECPDDIILDN